MADTGIFLTEAFAKISASADPAQFREAAEKAIKSGLGAVDAQVKMTLGTEQAKAQALALKEQLKKIMTDVGGSVKLDSADAQLKFAMLSASADRLNRKLGSEKISLDGVTKASLDLLKLQVQADKLKSTLSNEKLTGLQGLAGKVFGLGGGGSGGSGTVSKAGALLPPGAGGVAAGAGIAAVAVPAVAVLTAEIVALASGLAAATLGVGAFGLLAIPTIKEVTGALTAASAAQAAYSKAAALEKADPTKAHAAAAALALEQLQTAEQGQPAMVKTIVAGIDGLNAEFDRMAKKLQPDILKTFNDGLKLANTLLPGLLPFAQAAAPAIEGLLTRVSTFSASPQFKAWLAQLASVSGPAITAIGVGIGQVAIETGKLLVIFGKKDDIRAITAAFDVLAFTIAVLGQGIEDSLRLWHLLQDEWIAADGTAKHIAGDISGAWDDAFSALDRSVSGTIDNFRSLPGKVLAVLDALGPDLNATAKGWDHALLSGAEAGIGDIERFFKGIPSDILGWLGIHSPPDWAVQAGEHIVAGITGGLNRAKSRVGTATKAVAAAAAAGAGGPSGGAQLALENYAASLFPRYGWSGDQILALGALWQRESGWNRFARNPSSGAYGIAQALPPTKYPLAGQAAGGSNAAAQIGWGLDYIKSRYGTPGGAWAHELSAGWYDTGGWLMPGASVAVNRTGRAELVSRPDKLDEVVSAVKQSAHRICAAVETLTGVTAGNPASTAAALNGASSAAITRAMYPNRTGAGQMSGKVTSHATVTTQANGIATVSSPGPAATVSGPAPAADVP